MSKKNRDPLTPEDIAFLHNELRKSSVIWQGRKDALKAARRKVLVKRTKDGNPVYKFHWQCAACSKWKRSDKEMEVDHIVEIGGLGSFTGDWNEVIARIFPRPVSEHLQVLCLACHLRKTNAYNSARSKFVRKPKQD